MLRQPRGAHDCGSEGFYPGSQALFRAAPFASQSPVHCRPTRAKGSRVARGRRTPAAPGAETWVWKQEVKQVSADPPERPPFRAGSASKRGFIADGKRTQPATSIEEVWGHFAERGERSGDGGTGCKTRLGQPLSSHARACSATTRHQPALSLAPGAASRWRSVQAATSALRGEAGPRRRPVASGGPWGGQTRPGARQRAPWRRRGPRGAPQRLPK